MARVGNNFYDPPAEQAQYANEVFSSSYNFGFLGVTSPILELALEDMGKPIGVADYQLIVPKEKLQKVLTDEIKAFSEEKEKRLIEQANVKSKYRVVADTFGCRSWRFE